MRKLTNQDMKVIDIYCAGVCGGSAATYMVHGNTSAAVLGVICMIVLFVVAANRKV